jgi:hypothetical protein
MSTIQELRASMAILQAKIDALEKIQSDRPVKDEPYFEVEANGLITERPYTYDYDEQVFEQGNGFTTLRAAREETIRRGAMTRLRKMQNGYVPDRCGPDYKYTFRLYEHSFERDWTVCAFFPGWVYYESKEERDAALATLTAEEISAFLNWGM